MRRFMKLLHTVSGMGLAGGLAAYMLVLVTYPEPHSLESAAALRESLALVARWLLLPSMVLVLASGLLAMIVHWPFLDAGWVWVKAVSGILIFEATLASIDMPAQTAASVTARAVAGEIDAAQMAQLVQDKWGAWWILLGLSVANVAIAIWKPRFGWRRRAPQEG